MTAKANKNEAEELLGNLDAEQKQAEAALKETSKATRKKTGKTAGVAMEKTSKKITGKTASDATILKATTAAKNINGTVGGKHGKAIDESANRVTGKTPQKRPDKAIGEKLGEAAGKRPDKATKLLKDAILKAAEQAGNQLGEDGLVSYLEAQALKNASSFLTLLGKVLPAELANNGQEIKTVTKIELVAMKDPFEEKTSRKDK